jgi:hypothetical protein
VYVGRFLHTFQTWFSLITLAQTGQALDRAVIDAFVDAAENPANLVKEPSQECLEVVCARASLDSPSGEVLGVRPMIECWQGATDDLFYYPSSNVLLLFADPVDAVPVQTLSRLLK